MTSKLVYVARNGLITLFKTNKGYVGRAFDEVKKGDQIFCLRGSIAPCILRGGNNGYTYVSQAYGRTTLPVLIVALPRTLTSLSARIYERM